MEYSSEKSNSYFASFAWICGFWAKYIAQFLHYELIYVDLNACMVVVYYF